MTQSESKTALGQQLALAVRIGPHQHAVPVTAVEEVLPALPIERIPGAPDFVRGVIFVRGRLIPVLDAAERLGLKDHARSLEPHIVSLRMGDQLLGLEVDEALDLVDLGQGTRLSADEMGARRGFFTGVVELDGEIIRLLNPDRLLADEETVALDEMLHTA
jgi:purine-binding chemotaxis protein CheW